MSAGRGSSELARPARRRRPRLARSSTTAPRCSAAARASRSRGDRREAASTRPIAPAAASTTGASSSCARARSSSSRAGRAARAAAPDGSARSCSASTMPAGSATPETSAPGFTDAEIDRLLALLRPLESATSPFAGRPKLPPGRRDRVHLGRAHARRRGRVRRMDTRRPPARARLPRAARRQAGDDVRRERPPIAPRDPARRDGC